MYKNNNNYDNHTSLAVVDGIAYPINPNNIDGLSWQSNEYKLLTKGLKLIIETGEVTLSANREELQYDEKTQKAIKNRISEIMDRVSESLVQQVNNHDSYREAAIFYHDFRNYLDFAIPNGFVPEWKGHKLCTIAIPLNPDTIKNDGNGNKIPSYHIDQFEFRKNRRTYSTSLHKETYYNINIDKKSAIILNDLNQERVSRNRVEYFLQNNPDLKRIYVVSFSDLDVKAGLERMKKDNKWNVDINWFDPVLMSTINPPRKQGKRRGGRGGSGRSSYKAFVYDSSYTAYRSCDAGWRPTEVDMAEGEGVYVVISGRTNEISSQKHKLTNDQVSKIVAYADDKDLKIHGIREKDIHRLGEGWVPLKMWLDVKVDEELEELDITVGEIATVMQEHCYVFSESIPDINQLISGLIKKRRNETPATSVMLRYYDLSIEIEKQWKDLMQLWRVATIFPRPNSESSKNCPLAEFAKAFTVTYPMLKELRSWSGGPTGNEIFEYILLVDREAERQAALDNDGRYDQPIAVNE
jgi:hypothetical protein